jgi:hypothetical protein
MRRPARQRSTYERSHGRPTDSDTVRGTLGLSAVAAVLVAAVAAPVAVAATVALGVTAGSVARAVRRHDVFGDDAGSQNVCVPGTDTCVSV